MSISISIISAIISLISLVLAIKEMRLKVGKQKIEQFYRYGIKLESFYFSEKDMVTKGANGQLYSAVVSLRIANDSAYPITIDSAYITEDEEGIKEKRYHDNIFSFYEKEERGISISVCDKALLPMTIPAYGVALVSINVPFFDSFIKRPGDTLFPYLHLTTARKTHTLKIEVPEYNALIREK